MNLSRPSPQLHPGTIADDGNEPGRHLRLPSELIQVFVSGEEGILNRILCVGRIGQVSIRCSVEQRPIARENVLRFTSFIFSRNSVEAPLACPLHMVFAFTREIKMHARFQTTGLPFSRAFSAA